METDRPPGNWRGICDKVKGLPITVQAGDDFSVEMTVRTSHEVSILHVMPASPLNRASDCTLPPPPPLQPPGIVVPEVIPRWRKLFFNIGDGFESYEGPAGVIVTMPPRYLDEIDANAGAIINVLSGVSTGNSGLDIEAHTGSMVYVQDLDDVELEIDADGGSTVVVLAEDSNDYLTADIEADEGATVVVSGAERADIDDIDLGASIMLIGDNLEKVDMGDVDAGSTAFAQFSGRSRDYMYIGAFHFTRSP